MLNLCLCATVLMSACSVQPSAVIPDGVLHTECHERYFMIAVDLAFTGEELRFEAVGGNGVYPITELFGARHGYTVQVLPLQGRVELRASYFSPHAQNKDDKVFGFRFNLIVARGAAEETYAVNEACSPSLPWSPREVTCEANYMEVNVRSEVTCSSGANRDDWNSLKAAHGSTTSDWQVMFQQGEDEHAAMSLSEAAKQGYTFYLTDGRLVFRTPYGQPHSLSTEVSGVPVEAVHVTMYSRQSWVVLMVDLVAACSMDPGSPDGDLMVWETPAALYPSFSIVEIRVGLDGKLLDQRTAEERGYTVEKRESAFQVGVPFDADGRSRKSFVNGSLLEFYAFRLYFEQILLDEDQVETRLRLHRTMATVLQCPISTENRTALAEMAFTVYLGEVPEDVALAAVALNGEEYTLPFGPGGPAITRAAYANNTHGYTLKVPFDDPAVERKLDEEDAVLRHDLRITYALMILPENTTYYHAAAVTALLPYISPPDVDASCLDSGIRFTLEHRPFSHLWQIAVGPAALTSDLAAWRGYAMSNDSERLQLDVPLFTAGYSYENVTLAGFSGTFEISLRRPKTSEAHDSFAMTCPFSPPEYIFCSNVGMVTVMVDLSTVAAGAVDPAGSRLLEATCPPRAWEGTRVQFSFSLNSCGTTVQVDGSTVTYQNEILLPEGGSERLGIKGRPPRQGIGNFPFRLIVRCSYPVARLHQLFSTLTFLSDTAGVGAIVHAAQKDPATAPPTAPLTRRPAYVAPFEATQSAGGVEVPGARGFLDHIRGELDKLYSKIRRWISENCFSMMSQK